MLYIFQQRWQHRNRPLSLSHKFLMLTLISRDSNPKFVQAFTYRSPYRVCPLSFVLSLGIAPCNYFLDGSPYYYKCQDFVPRPYAKIFFESAPRHLLAKDIIEFKSRPNPQTPPSYIPHLLARNLAKPPLNIPRGQKGAGVGGRGPKMLKARPTGRGPKISMAPPTPAPQTRAQFRALPADLRLISGLAEISADMKTYYPQNLTLAPELNFSLSVSYVIVRDSSFTTYHNNYF